MTPTELVTGFISGRRHVIVLPFEDQPEQRGEIVGYYKDLEDDDAPTEADRFMMLDDCFFVVRVDKKYRGKSDRDGLRDGVSPDQMRWEDADVT